VAIFGMGSMRADFSYQQTSQITGGSMQAMMRMAGAFSKQAREPMAATVMVSGHRMAHVNAHTAQIIDVDKETITDINFDKKTYTVMTFAQMKQMLDDMSKRMQQKQTENADLHYKASAKDTGQTKTINGLTAREVLVTITMEGTDKKTGDTGSMDATSDMWIAPVAGYEEVRSFYRIYAGKMGMMPGQNMGIVAAQPGMAKAMGDLYKEMAKVDGTPVQMITRLGGVGGGTASGASNSGTQQQQQTQAGSQTAGQTAAGAALGRLGLGGFGRRKKNTEDQPQQQQTSSEPASGGEPQAASGVLMEMTTDTSGFSTAAVDASKFEVPAGFKQVEPEMGRRGK